MVQTAGPAETVAAIASGRIHAAALSPPATLQAKKAKLKELLDMSKLDAEYHINGVVTSRRFLKTNEDTVRRFLRAYIEAAARGQRDRNFAVRAMAKTFRSEDRELLDESYDLIIKPNFVVPPYPSLAGIASLLKGLEPTNPKAKASKPEDHADSHIVRELEQSGFIKAVLAER
jgi:ABC-type nitrate/sulfonate/bicarbonate transport system substrate-binding protein